ncbi:Uclacyanin 1 like [Actinidia chinensis var. chinensis]|uniref:Uclacyanin 1 like n=1 Tax=Actinidia chinensis var. chinensis TaxID=1590841 RepID=A0A2R6R7K4_ACTCC|nr:Uclacyanin 1 like [Actinidia chinensis var. chinensis]
MAFKHVFIILAIISPVMVSAKDFIVGDEKGWTLNFDYQAWAQGKDFRVGDRLVFKYPVGVHNVFKVNGTGFQNCIKPPLSEALTSGNDTIILATPGRKWYICGVARHCAAASMKLFINVNADSPAPTMAPSPSPSPSQSMPYANSAYGSIRNVLHPAMVVLVALVSIFGA